MSEYVREQARTNGIELFWAQFRRGYNGVFHKFREKRLDRYVREFSDSYNLR